MERLKRLGKASRTLVVGGVFLCAVVATNLCLTQRAVPPTLGTDSPALSATLVALGGCRGIISEGLWWRIADLQRQNRYAELVPLTDLLVTLDPASGDTWVYNAWNLSYNISAAHHDVAEKWHWVKEGILLLERGLRAAPQSEPILRQLGWTFEDKIAGSADEAAPYYRAQMGTLEKPADAEVFIAAVGFEPNWKDPIVRALYWYWRAEHGRDMLRVTLRLAVNQGQAAWMPFLLQTARKTWDELAPRQCEQVIHILRMVPQTHPLRGEIEDFLKEVTL